jgi:hypothetical protein
MICRYNEPPDIGVMEFLEIWGGCADLGLSGIWFQWCTPLMVVSAWRHVGICGNRLDPSQICRTGFLDRQPGDAPPSPPPSAGALLSPLAGSLPPKSPLTLEQVSATHASNTCPSPHLNLISFPQHPLSHPPIPAGS